MKDKLKKGYLQWRCRRGTKELDVVLTQFLDNNYEQLSAAELMIFDELLSTQDTQLWYWISGQQQVDSSLFRAIIDKIDVKN
ncbi:MAG: succinate dehydrogenase assembly factor 2 [Alcanivoracaceae bacterium]|nr:succinate dehydrogenase assembly factor 2 [Alcanivoracaceae bacterium]